MMRCVFLICAALLTGVIGFTAEYLPVCEKCLNPRVISKAGGGTSAASADALVVQEDAVVWCAANRPRDPYCAREEVRNGGDGGRKSYKATADCSAGVLHSIDGYEYRYAGVWPDGPGRGRPMLKDTGGNIRRWNSITSGYGIARAEWDRYGGYSLTRQWETLCGSSAPSLPAQTRPVPTPTAARTAQVISSARATGESLASCFRCPAPSVVSKSGIGTANAVAEARMTAAELRTTCAETDPQNIEACVRREMREAGNKIYRAKADCTSGRITTIDDQQYTLAGIWDHSDIGGGRTKWHGSDGQIVGRDNASGGLAISQQWELLCPGPLNAVLLSRAAAAPARPAGQASPAPNLPPTTAVCTGKRYCQETASFAAIVRDFRPSAESNSTRVVSATLKFLNKSNRPLILGYLRSAAVAIDERGNRYTLLSAESVRGMGELGGREFDPKFTLQPGQTADTRFEFVWRWNGRDIIGQKSWDIELAFREVGEVAPGQYRFGAEHALQFRGVPAASATVSESVTPPAMSEAQIRTAASAPAAESPRPDACAGKPRCFDAGNFVAEIQNTTLTREGNFQDRVARLNVKVRNTGHEPLSLAYVAKSSVLTDNLGNRFFWGTAGTYDMSATGIGKVEANKADPQLTLAPGEWRMATFTLRRRTAKTDPDGTAYTYNVTLAELQVLNGQQVRTTREHSLTFADFPLSASGVAPAATPARSTEQSIRGLTDAIRGLGRKK
jgi:hypothetical protein